MTQERFRGAVELPKYRPYCLECRKPRVACLCNDAEPVPCPYRVIVLQHPRESRRPIGTARILRLCLPQADILVGPDFHRYPLYRELIAGETMAPLILFPSDSAQSADDFAANPAWRDGRQPTLVLLDGTWSEARGLWRNNPELWDWPRVRIDGAPPSNFRIKRQPRAGYLSTVEAAAELLERLERLPGKYDPLRKVFAKMVDFQIEKIQTGSPRMNVRKRARREAMNHAATQKSEARRNAQPRGEREGGEKEDGVESGAAIGSPSSQPNAKGTS